MAKDHDKSLGDQNTFDGGVKRVESSQQSLGDQSTFGDAGSSISDLSDLPGGIDDEMPIVDLSERYTIEGVLGKGGMGEVLLATDTRLKRKVAIKRVLGTMAKSKTAVRRFTTEAQSIAALSNHPNIVDIYDYGRDEDGPFLIMEYIDGGCLLDRCQDGALPLEEAIELTCQLCGALETAHEANIIHRDIKPANVLLTKDGIPALSDFGLAKDEVGDTGHTMAGAVLGTLDFMPPEQRRDATLTDARSDLWSLAATLYQMVTGEPPRVIDLGEVPQQLRQTLSKALKTKPDARFQTAREFRDALRASLTAQEPEPEVAVDLGEGECFRCHTRNSSTRKFCRECAASLRVACLKCEEEIPVWDKVCGECGAQQQELIGQRREAMAQRQEQAMAHLSEFQYDQSRAIANELGDEPDRRFEYLREWSEQFLLEIDTQRTQQLERIEALLSEALQHETAADYQAGIRALEQTPKILRETSVPNQSLTAVALLTRLQKKQSEVQRLDRLIKRRVKSQKLNGLQKEVDSLLELCPNREDMTELKEQLVERDRKLTATRDEALAEAKDLFESQDYEGCLRQIARIDASLLAADITVLREKAEAKRDRLKSLRDSIASSMKAKQFGGLLAQVEECLSLQSGAADLHKWREQLVEREEKNAAALAEAKDLFESQDYEGCLRQIARIDASLLAADITVLREKAEDKRDRLKSLRDSIASSVKAKQFGGLLAQVEECLSLQSGAADLHKWREQLVEREEKVAEAKDLFESQDYEGCLRQIARIDASLLAADITVLREKAQAKEAKKFADDRLRLAKEQRAIFDHGAAVQTLESIPAAIRPPEALRILEKSRSEHQELQSLMKSIENRVQKDDLAGLLVLVTRAIELSGKTNYLETLQNKIERQMDDFANQLSERGVNLFKQHKYLEAIEVFEQASELSQEYSMFRIRVAMCLRQLNRLNEAITELEVLYERDPKNATVIYNLACYASLSSDPKKALDYLAESIAIDNRFVELAGKDKDFKNEGFTQRVNELLQLGFELRRQGEYAEAIKVLEQASMVFPGNAHLSIEVAECLRGMNKLDQAIAKLKETLESIDLATILLDPNNAVVLYNLACYSSLVSSTQEALDYLEKSIGIDSQFGIRAGKDPDFVNLHCDPRFKRITGFWYRWRKGG